MPAGLGSLALPLHMTLMPVLKQPYYAAFIQLASKKMKQPGACRAASSRVRILNEPGRSRMAAE